MVKKAFMPIYEWSDFLAGQLRGEAFEDPRNRRFTLTWEESECFEPSKVELHKVIGGVGPD